YFGFGGPVCPNIHESIDRNCQTNFLKCQGRSKIPRIATQKWCRQKNFHDGDFYADSKGTLRRVLMLFVLGISALIHGFALQPNTVHNSYPKYWRTKDVKSYTSSPNGF